MSDLTLDKVLDYQDFSSKSPEEWKKREAELAKTRAALDKVLPRKKD